MGEEGYSYFQDSQRETWFARNYKTLAGGLIMLMLVALGVSAYSQSSVSGGVYLKSGGHGGSNRNDVGLVDGNEYGFTIQTDCICGGGEGHRVDQYVIIYECWADGSYHKLATTGVVDNSGDATFENAFKLKYLPGLPQNIYFDLMDEDTNANDKLAVTNCFNPFDQYPGSGVPISKTDEWERCTIASGACGSDLPFIGVKVQG